MASIGDAGMWGIGVGVRRFFEVGKGLEGELGEGLLKELVFGRGCE